MARLQAEGGFEGQKAHRVTDRNLDSVAFDASKAVSRDEGRQPSATAFAEEVDDRRAIRIEAKDAGGEKLGAAGTPVERETSARRKIIARRRAAAQAGDHLATDYEEGDKSGEGVSRQSEKHRGADAREANRLARLHRDRLKDNPSVDVQPCPANVILQPARHAAGRDDQIGVVDKALQKTGQIRCAVGTSELRDVEIPSGGQERRQHRGVRVANLAPGTVGRAAHDLVSRCH